MPKVLIAPTALANLQGSFLDTLKNGGFEPIYHGRPTQLEEDELLAALDDAEASLAGSEPYTERVLEAHPRLKVIARVGVGYDAVDVVAATKQGIAVCIA